MKSTAAILACFVASGCADDPVAPTGRAPIVVVDGRARDCESITLMASVITSTIVRFEVRCLLDPFPTMIDDECTAYFVVESVAPLTLGEHAIDAETTYEAGGSSPPPQRPVSSINRAGGDVQGAWAMGAVFVSLRTAGTQLATGVFDVQTLEGSRAMGRLSVAYTGRNLCGGAGTESSIDIDFDVLAPP